MGNKEKHNATEGPIQILLLEDLDSTNSLASHKLIVSLLHYMNDATVQCRPNGRRAVGFT